MWLSSAKNRHNIEYIVSIDESDLHKESYNSMEGIILINDNKTAIEAINYAASKCTGDLIVVLSDDFLCPYHWDDALLKEVEGKYDFVLKTKDGLQPWILTLPIVDRIFYERYGYVYHPGYSHLFCDTDLASVATITDKLIYSDITFLHNHYTTGKTKKDAINEKNDRTWNQGEQLYLERLMRYFDIPEDQRINPINQVPSHHLQWLSSKGISFTNA